VPATATEAGFGVTAIDANEITLSVTAGDVTPLFEAVICVVPAATPVARPVLEIVAVPGVPDVQVTVELMSAVVLSLKVPVAVNCCVAPTLIDAGVAGVTAMDLSDFPPGVVGPLQPVRTQRTNNGNTSAAKRRGRDFISPPRTGHTKFFWRHTDLKNDAVKSPWLAGLGVPLSSELGPLGSLVCLLQLQNTRTRTLGQSYL